MGWLVGRCHSHGSLDGQGGRPAFVPAGYGICRPASVDVVEARGEDGKAVIGWGPDWVGEWHDRLAWQVKDRT